MHAFFCSSEQIQLLSFLQMLISFVYMYAASLFTCTYKAFSLLRVTEELPEGEVGQSEARSSRKESDKE